MFPTLWQCSGVAIRSCETVSSELLDLSPQERQAVAWTMGSGQP
jgi:hypothetical protein